MSHTISPRLESIRLLLEAAEFARNGQVEEATTLAGISANLAEYGNPIIDLEEDFEEDEKSD